LSNNAIKLNGFEPIPEVEGTPKASQIDAKDHVELDFDNID